MRLRTMMSYSLIPAAFLILTLTIDPAAAQSGTRSRGVQSGSGNRSSGSGTQSGSTSRRSSQQTFESKLWDYLNRQKYWNWAPVPGRSETAYPGQSPHGAFLKMYLNRRAAGNSGELPNGSIIIKENYASDGKTLAAITVMYRTKDYNPDAGNWYWVKYNANGTVAKTPPDKGSMRLAGTPQGCIECHAGADGDDYAFFNDEP